MRKGRTWSAELTVMGLRFRWTKDVRRNSMPGWCPFPVELEREPDNKYDPNAIKVNIAADYKLKKLRGVQLGYLRANIAELLAPKLDAGTLEAVSLTVTSVDDDGETASLDARFRDLPRPVKRA